ncbi:TauD/TfdA dioxygenase family protein TDEL_0G04710 [Torulaspora delbrueckii]|uniref:TauD/TfdA-like domain-containing protein n=1 Tax=Torulaspora delbrueckii TaxID=4950 RepID=G8ZY71_TORDE|nr:hypothetical protein TDEL_0G04710 [Torulaspora delbrueckii]CCE93838.1 hypothetical protein TDEL_0G04710 [Torulaspora delbrueckii]
MSKTATTKLDVETEASERFGKLNLVHSEEAPRTGDYDTHFYAGQDEVSEDGILRINSEYRAKSTVPDFLPTWDPREKLPPLEFHEYHDPGLRADPSFPNLFPEQLQDQYKTKRITPKLGTEVRGVQLSQLTDAGKDELALLVAQRGIVVFRDQDFSKAGPQGVVDYAKHFGKLHVHQTSGHPENVPELHITYRRPDHKEFERVFEQDISSIFWHTDVSYELQPPSYTFFNVLEGPNGGGDTLFADAFEAFDRLSPTMQEFISGLHVIHSAYEQAENSKGAGGVQRRLPTAHIHPLVRVHPVLKRKALFVNESFSRRIVELKKPESDALLRFLYDIVGRTHDLQLRANWEPNTVAIWDNRRVQHSAVVDWEEPVHRHAFRITPQGERPVEDLKYLNDKNYYGEEVPR